MINSINQIKIHNSKSFENMRVAGRLAADCLDLVTEYIKPGISTEEINTICHDFQQKNGATGNHCEGAWRW